VLLPDNSGHLHSVIRLTGGRAVATSGDYRQFFLDINNHSDAYKVQVHQREDELKYTTQRHAHTATCAKNDHRGDDSDCR